MANPPPGRRYARQDSAWVDIPGPSRAPEPARPRFLVGDLLVKGSQGYMYKAIDTTNGQQVAIKYIKRTWVADNHKYVHREVMNHRALSECKHPHVVELYEVFLTSRYLGVVMEYVEGETLQQYLAKAGGKLPEDVARYIFQQLMIAVDFCHRKGKVNRDIKLGNIFVAENKLPLIKLCDFGFSKDIGTDSPPQTQLGTALFTAPEIIVNVGSQPYDGEAADVWSCGVVLSIMLFGGHPFLWPDDYKEQWAVYLIENSLQGNLHLPPEAAACPGAVDLLKRMLHSSPAQRAKVPDILTHPWFTTQLPPGALALNDAYLYMAHVQNTMPRQSSDVVEQILHAGASLAQELEGFGEQGVPSPVASDSHELDPQDLGMQQLLPATVQSVVAQRTASMSTPASPMSLGLSEKLSRVQGTGPGPMMPEIQGELICLEGSPSHDSSAPVHDDA